MKIDTIIVSDIHLGSPISQAKKLTELLQNMHFNRLILLGDIFHNVRVDKLTKDHFDFLDTMFNFLKFVWRIANFTICY